VATKNLIDNTSTTVSASTPGVQLDLRYRTTLSRAALGVPVRFWAYASSTVASDTGYVQILDSAGAAKLTVPITGTTAQWYATEGYLPATDAKYDAHYGGNTLGTLNVYAFTVHEYADISPLEGVLASSIGTFALSAEGTVANSITLDGTSGIGVPVDVTEWEAVFDAAGASSGTVDNIYECQEASGNAIDSIGGLDLTAASISAYQEAVSGWTRDAATTEPESGFRSFTSSSSSFPDKSTTSQMALFYYFRATAVSSEYSVGFLGSTNVASLLEARMTSSEFLKVLSGNTTSATGTIDYGVDTVIPIILQHDYTNSVQRLVTHQEVLTPTFTALSTGPGLGIGAGAVGCAPGGYLYAANFNGASAELTRTQLKALLEELGWSVSWTP